MLYVIELVQLKTKAIKEIHVLLTVNTPKGKLVKAKDKKVKLGVFSLRLKPKSISEETKDSFCCNLLLWS